MQDSRYDPNADTKAGLKFAAVIVSIIIILTAGIWGARVLFSDVKGRGDAQIAKNAANNRIQASEKFEDLMTEVLATDRKLDEAAADKKASPNQTTATIYSGLKNHCEDTVALYNAAARKYTSEQFRAIDLPAKIDQSDPTMDCKESTK